MSTFVTFEGIEGSGKTYQAKRFYRYLQRRKIVSVLTHEPGGTPVGERIARVLMQAVLDPLTELMLFNASRAELIAEVIKPQLKNGSTVVCDRYADSTLVYQGYGRGLDLDMVRLAVDIVIGPTRPQVTVLLDLPVEEGLARKHAQSLNRFDLETVDFHRRVREGYLTLAAAEPQRWVVIDSSRSRDEVARAITDAVAKRFPSSREVL